MFPHEAVPDGAVAAPHHYYIGVLLVLLVAATCWDDLRDDPVLVVGGQVIGLFGFTLTWPWYPETGAALALAGLGLSTGTMFRPYWGQFRRRAVVILLGLLVAWDDALEHAYGVPTPLDALWAHHLQQYIA